MTFSVLTSPGYKEITATPCGFSSITISAVNLSVAAGQGVDENNLVAIEVETANKPKRDDIWKLEGLTEPLEGYGYKLGLFLVFGVEEKAGQLLAKEWYADGKRV